MTTLKAPDRRRDRALRWWLTSWWWRHSTENLRKCFFEKRIWARKRKSEGKNTGHWKIRKAATNWQTLVWKIWKCSKCPLKSICRAFKEISSKKRPFSIEYEFETKNENLTAKNGGKYDNNSMSDDDRDEDRERCSLCVDETHPHFVKNRNRFEDDQ